MNAKTPAVSETEREAFKGWTSKYDLRPFGGYSDEIVSHMWKAWQARAAIAVKADWQPMETAPKDGSEFLCQTADIGKVVVFWDSWENPPMWSLGFCRDSIQATCWMPLPADSK